VKSTILAGLYVDEDLPLLEGLLEKAKRRGAHRRKRERRPLPGMMLHQDGSMHVWLAASRRSI